MATKRELTVMFIDVAGFSLTAETSAPAALFQSLRAVIVKIRRIVRQHGGTVDKTLGDGLLCYFDSADAAVETSLALQREVLADCLAAAAKTGVPVYPIRIGLNTDDVILGDLGDDDAPEHTIVGDGVNYAKRIEDSCDIFMIMMSDKTHAKLKATTAGTSTLKRSIMIKHHERLFDVYELNPFADSPREVAEARKAYQDFRGIYRMKPRLEFQKDAPFDVQCDYGDCALVDVSLGGFQVQLKRYLARGVHVKIAISGQKKDRKAQYLNLIGLTTLNCLVKWGRPAPDGSGYLHGLQILNLNAEQLEIIYSMLAKYCIER